MIQTLFYIAKEYACTLLKVMKRWITILTSAIHSRPFYLFFVLACTGLTLKKNDCLYYYVQVYHRIPTLVGALVFCISYTGQRKHKETAMLSLPSVGPYVTMEDDLLCKVLISNSFSSCQDAFI